MSALPLKVMAHPKIKARPKEVKEELIEGVREGLREDLIEGLREDLIEELGEELVGNRFFIFRIIPNSYAGKVPRMWKIFENAESLGKSLTFVDSSGLADPIRR